MRRKRAAYEQRGVYHPRLNARRVEEVVTEKVRSRALTETSIRALVRIVDERMDGLVSQRL